MAVKLKAKWTASDFYTITYMQEMTSTICSTATKPSVSAKNVTFTKTSSTSLVPRTVLLDSRDSKKYLVSRLADGNCWMSQNLALNLSSTTSLTNTNTDLNTKSSWKPANSTNTSISPWGTTNRIASQTDHSYRPSGDYLYYRSGNSHASSPTGTSDSYLWESAGNYYNWYAATAGSGTYNLVDQTTNDSICPKNWRLPTGTGNKSYSYLIDTIYKASAYDILSSPLNIPMAGAFDHINGGQFAYDGDGVYWTATSYSNENAMDLDFVVGQVMPGYNYYKGRGYNVRCVAR